MNNILTMSDMAHSHNFFSHLNKDSIVITPHHRLAAYLSKQYCQYQKNLGKIAWETPTILTLATYIEKLWAEYLLNSFEINSLLLNTAQENFIWEKIISSSQEAAQLLQPKETALSAKSAWALLQQWQVNLFNEDLQSSEDSKMLFYWIKNYQALCAKENYIDNAIVINKLCELLLSKSLISPTLLIFVGFNELTPQIKNFIACCESVGSRVLIGEIQPITSHRKRIMLSDQEDELITAARWARKLLTERPEASIACIVPNLEQTCDRITQLFSAVFVGQENLFNISAGKKLLQYPIIFSAFQFLTLQKNDLSIEAFSYLLISPFVGDGENEYHQRAKYDKQLRKNNFHKVKIECLLQNTFSLPLARSCPKLADRLRHFITFTVKNFTQQTSFSHWGKLFSDALQILGWPGEGERSLNSEEFQTLEQWQQLLFIFKSLDHIAPPCDFHQALDLLKSLATKQIFQPKAPDAPVQVLDLLEAAAIPFDHIWLIGVDDFSWPPQPAPHPWLPKYMQRKLDMPHATAEHELKYCKILLQQFAQNCKTFICSHAQQKEELMLQASPLIKNYTVLHKEDLNLPAYISNFEIILNSQKIESINDEQAPPLRKNERIRGGTFIYKYQAACPFRAFAECRLHTGEISATMPGFNAKERGTLLHKALELLWKEIKEHAKLVTMSSDELHSCINMSIDNALAETGSSNKQSSHYIKLEKQRLRKLLVDWLAIEKNREPFIVKFNEKKVNFDLNGLTISLRIDRIDELANGKKIIIDYKTGRQNNINHIFGDRPDEPQLPLYTLIDVKNTAGVTFAQVTSGEHCFKGVSQYKIAIEGIKPLTELKKANATSWAEQVEQWRTVICGLSNEFLQGIAKVNPKDGKQTCTWCNLKSLCRISEINSEPAPCD